MDNKSKIAIGFLAGAAVGVIAAILTSPDKGSATRQKIIDSTADLGNSLKDYVVDFFTGEKKKASAKAEEYQGANMKLNTMG